ILSFLYFVIDYVSICDPITMEDKDDLEEQILIALAVRVGKTRLIDNALIGVASKNGM
ncbi:MAG: pantoate--beta-alanine ligase, partial [Deltaproteobacteria bacterium]|nr:pantoate--beta-alanine ligase [Deltaproteobacteria bacterium]